LFDKEQRLKNLQQQKRIDRFNGLKITLF